MTLALSGTNGLLQAYDYQVLTTGFSYTFAAGTQVLVIDPAGTLATGTITMPASPADGMTITISSDQQITALTMSGNGGTIVGPAVQLIPNQPLSWVYRLANTTWYPVYGGAGRASALVSGTSVASTSGTSIDYTGIPSWVKRITVMFSGVSTNGASNWLVRIGNGSIVSSGYSSSSSYFAASTLTTQADTSGFLIRQDNGANTISGAMVIYNVSGNTWVETWVGGQTAQTLTHLGGGQLALSGVLDRVRITTVNGTDTFDAGSINILYE
jgi:hypothetical protein